MTEPVDPARLLASGKRALDRWGHVGTLSRPQTTGPAQNPVAAAPLTSPALMAATDYSSRDVDGARIKVADKLVYVDPASVTFPPSTTDTLLEPGNAQPFKIIAVEALKVRTTPVLYMLQCRR